MTNWEWPDSRIVRVIDGDSFVAQVTKDIGFNGSVTFQQKMRLNRINCPPVGTIAGQAAKDFVKNVSGGLPVHITTVGPYKYGDEWMAEVVLASARNLSDALVDNQLAVYWDGKGPRPLGAEDGSV